MPTLVGVEGDLLDRALDSTYEIWNSGLTRRGYGQFYQAQIRTPWGERHLRMYALVDRGQLLASVKRYNLTAMVSGQLVTVCGLGALFTVAGHRRRGYASELVEQVLTAARQEGAEFGLMFSEIGDEYYRRLGFEPVPAPPATSIRVLESPRHGAPMTMMRVGEVRDFDAIVAMGRARAERAAFHLDRDRDFLHYGITKHRLLAGLGRAGARELQFFIAEEGITAAAYLLMTVSGSSWIVEECGDRDATYARVGALLQTVIARAPAERRPSIVGWLPPGFAPPQVALSPAPPSPELMMMKSLVPGRRLPQLLQENVLYWRTDLF